jgi:multicomponent Na+:H+ antiporter subunit G
MMPFIDGLALAIAALGTFFFCAGAIGLVRLPDIYSRLHALTKADNLGLGLIVIAMMLLSDSWLAVLKLGLIWLFILIASSCLCILIAREAYRHNVPARGSEEP